MSTSTEQLQRITDDLEIRDLVARFANACSPPNLEAFAKLWIPDAHEKAKWIVTEPFTSSATGVADIVALLDKLLAPWDFFVQLVHTGVVKIDGNNATGRFIVREVGKGPNETYYNNFAIYEDRYSKVEGKWYIARRQYDYMFLDSGPFGGNICPPIKGWFDRN